MKGDIKLDFVGFSVYFTIMAIGITNSTESPRPFILIFIGRLVINGVHRCVKGAASRKDKKAEQEKVTTRNLRG